MNQMKKKRKIRKYQGGEMLNITSRLPEENNAAGNNQKRLFSGESPDADKYWKKLINMDNKEINVDRAWDKLFSRLHDNGLLIEARHEKRTIRKMMILKIAAAALIIIGVGAGIAYLGNKGLFDRRNLIATNENQKNLQVTLPDGSIVSLNRNTSLRYKNSFGRHQRNVTLSGEAFFEIFTDPERPFIVDVKSGKVLLSSERGNQNIELDPGYIGIIDSGRSVKTANTDPNYLAWNTGSLVYDGQTLDVVFRDLKRVYNMEIIADDTSILKNTWTSPINNQPQETIIRLICASFNLSYIKDGNIYHLAEN